MIKRRDFIKSTGALALGGMLVPTHLFSRPAKHAVGLQLFTLFNQIDDDVTGWLKKVSDIGYKEIESAFSKKGGYYGYKPKEFAKVTKDLGLSWKSHHVLGAQFKLPPGAKMPAGPDGKPMTIPPMRNLTENMQELVDEAAEGGVQYLVCANAPFGTLEEMKSSIAVLNKSGEACSKAGLTFAYHNHDAEFHAVEGKVPYDLILSDTSTKHVKMELDIAWSIKGGADPVEIFTKNPGRFPLWHMKDLTKDFSTIVPIGEGVIDYKKYFAVADKAGMKHFFVEHDMPPDALASITTSFANVQKLI